MKKSLIALLLVAALCFTFAACGTTPTPAPSDDVPTEEGKITFKFTLSDASVQQEDYVSFFMTGKMLEWTTGTSAPVFTRLNDTNVYYTIVDVTIDPTAEGGLDYQLKLGYNENSGAPASEMGLTWSNDSWKSDECAAPGGVNNLAFEYAEGQQVIDLGTHTFSTKAGKPVTVSPTFVVNFKEAVPEGTRVAIYGGFNNWTDDNFMATEDNKTFKYTASDLVVQEYQFKVVVYAEGVYEEGGQWGENSVQYGANGEVGADNANVSVQLVDDGEELDAFDGIELVF